MPTINCPNCNQSYEVDDNVVGEKVECAVCETTFIAKTNDIPEMMDRKIRSQEQKEEPMPDITIPVESSPTPIVPRHDKKLLTLLFAGGGIIILLLVTVIILLIQRGTNNLSSSRIPSKVDQSNTGSVYSQPSDKGAKEEIESSSQKIEKTPKTGKIESLKNALIKKKTSKWDEIIDYDSAYDIWYTIDGPTVSFEKSLDVAYMTPFRLSGYFASAYVLWKERNRQKSFKDFSLEFFELREEDLSLDDAVLKLSNQNNISRMLWNAASSVFFSEALENNYGYIIGLDNEIYEEKIDYEYIPK